MTETAHVLVPACEVMVGDRVLIPQHGLRVVTEISVCDHLGLEQTPNIRIVYALGSSLALSRFGGMVSTPQPEASLRPFLPDELVAIAPRPLCVVRELDDEQRQSTIPIRNRIDNVDDAKRAARALRDQIARPEVRADERNRAESVAVDGHEREPEHPSDPTTVPR